MAARYAATHSGMGVCQFIKRLGVLGLTPVLRQKSDCFQPSDFSASANSEGFMVAVPGLLIVGVQFSLFV